MQVHQQLKLLMKLIKLNHILDFINLMTYDLHGGGWENVTGLHTALYARPDENSQEITLNQVRKIKFYFIIQR